MIYIASPFFKESELNFVKLIEDNLEKYAIDYFSPRNEGVLQNLTEEEKQIQKSRIYQSNIDNIRLCDTMVAVIDGRDTGTIWEMGYASALKKDIISISNKSYGLNVMLAESVRIHLGDIQLLIQAIRTPGMRSPSSRGVF